jgi:uncharacterized protein (TIGR04255 family)
MAEYPHLKNAPISEAIIDLRVKPQTGFQFEKLSTKKLSSFKLKIHDRYPEFKEHHFFKTEVKIQDGKLVQPTSEVTGIDGFIIKSMEGGKVAQFTDAGFTFSQLKPYTCWKDIFGEAKLLWELYVSLAAPELVTRIAARYINQLEISLPINDFSEYLEAPPKVPDNVPNQISNFLNKITVYDQKKDIMANITQTLGQSLKPSYATIILDIDVFKRKDFHIGDEDMWRTFEQIRKLKNEIFFANITEKTKRLFE